MSGRRGCAPRCDECVRTGAARCDHLDATDAWVDAINAALPGDAAASARLRAAASAASSNPDPDPDRHDDQQQGEDR